MIQISIQLVENSEDLLYSAFNDRLYAKAMGINAGVVEENDYKVTAGSGLQVEVEKGNAWVAQTGATQESSNTFFNGLYQVPSSTKINPSNNVEVSGVNPQIAQIIVRVYDINELKISGSSSAKIEWLNGAATAEATEAHMKEGKYEDAAALPVSSLRLAYVLVPKNAASSAAYYIEDARVWAAGGLKISLANKYQSITNYGINLVVKSRAVSYEAKSGELGEVTKSGITCTLPLPAPANQQIAVFNVAAEAIKVTTSGGATISGDFVAKASTVELQTYQHLLVQSDGTNWLILAGEPAEGRPIRSKVAGASQNFLSWGVINGAGAIGATSGDFTVSHGVTGTYAVAWNNEKPLEYYAVDLTLVSGEEKPPAAVVSERTKAGFHYKTYNAGGELHNEEVMFIVLATG